MYRDINDRNSFSTVLNQESRSVMEKYGKFLYETCENKDVENALSILRNREVVSAATDQYVTVPTELVIGAILDKGVGIKSWKIDMYGDAVLPKDASDEEKERCKFSGKFRVVLVVEAPGYFGQKRDLAIYVYGSADRSMRFAIFAGWLEWLCLNGCFTGEILGDFIRQRHRGFTLEELLMKVEENAQAVVDFVNSDEVKKMSRFMDMMDNTVVSYQEQKALTRKALEKRIALNFPKKNLEENKHGVIKTAFEITNEQVEQYVADMRDQAREGHKGATYNQFMQRLQEAVGANPNDSVRSNHCPRIDFIRKDWNDEKKDYDAKSAHIRQTQLPQGKIELMNELNLYITELFQNELSQLAA